MGRRLAGAPVRLIFENPDLMPHNLVVVAPGADEEVGGLADVMASDPGAMAKPYVPASPKVLHAPEKLGESVLRKRGYPMPVVDHQKQKPKALALFK